MAWSSTTVDVSHMHPSLVREGQSRVCFKALCVVASSVSVLVLGCSAHSGPCARRWERGMGFGDDVVAQQPPHPCLVVHNTVCHVTPCVFPFSVPRIEQFRSLEYLLCLWCQCVHVQSNCLGKHLLQCFHDCALKVHMVHCISLATLAPVCWLCMKCNLVCNTP